MSSEINYSAKNLTLINRFSKNPDRYYVEEFFNILPGLESPPVFSQSTSITNTVSTSGGSKYGIVRTVDTRLNLNVAREFTFNNSLINSNSLISTNIQSVSGNINDSQTFYGNSALSVFTHSKEIGACKIRLMNIGNESRAIQLPLQKYDIGFNINPHIPVNPNWSITGTAVKSNSVIPADSSFGAGIILSNNDNSTAGETILQLRNNSNSGFSATTITANQTILITDTDRTTINLTSDPTSLFFPGDPVYNSSGNLLGILKNISASQFTFIDNIPIGVSNGDVFYLRNTNNVIGSSKFFNTKNQFEFECSIKTGSDSASITNGCWWVGLKETSTGIVDTDGNQAYFFYDATTTSVLRPSLEVNTLTYNSLFFVYSISGINYVNRLPITIASNTVYKYRITIDENRKLAIFVDSYSSNSYTTGKSSTQYGLSNGSSLAGTLVTTGTTKSDAMADIDIYPFIGVKTTDANSGKYITVNYVKMSRFSN